MGSNLSFCACRGYKRFFKRTALETSDYLKDDCLLVNCTVGVVQSHTEGPKIYTIPVPRSNMALHIGQLLTSGKRTDIAFEVDGEMFPAHKVILSARSPVFRAQLFGPMKDKDMKCIKIEDMEAPVFKVTLAPGFTWLYVFFGFGTVMSWGNLSRAATISVFYLIKNKIQFMHFDINGIYYLRSLKYGVSDTR